MTKNFLPTTGCSPCSYVEAFVTVFAQAMSGRVYRVRDRHPDPSLESGATSETVEDESSADGSPASIRSLLALAGSFAAPVIAVPIVNRPLQPETTMDYLPGLLQRSPYPILLVPASGRMQPFSLDSVLVPLDGTTRSEEALNFVEWFPAASRPLIRLIRIVSKFPDGAWDGAATEHEIPAESSDMSSRLYSARNYLDEVSQRLRSRNVAVIWEVRIGPPAEEIVRVAETTGTKLVVIASRHVGANSDSDESVAAQIAESLDSPVLILPERGQHFAEQHGESLRNRNWNETDQEVTVVAVF